MTGCMCTGACCNGGKCPAQTVSAPFCVTSTVIPDYTTTVATVPDYTKRRKKQPIAELEARVAQLEADLARRPLVIYTDHSRSPTGNPWWLNPTVTCQTTTLMPVEEVRLFVL